MTQVPLNRPCENGAENQGPAASGVPVAHAAHAPGSLEPLPAETASASPAETFPPRELTASETLPFGGKPGMILLLAVLFLLGGLLLGEVFVRLLASLFGRS